MIRLGENILIIEYAFDFYDLGISRRDLYDLFNELSSELPVLVYIDNNKIEIIDE